MRPIPRKLQLGRGAFTIVELVIVMLVMSIFAAAATPVFLESLLLHRVESAARRVKSDLELARHAARLTSATQSISFTNSTYTVTGTNHLDNPNAVYAVDLASPPYELDGVTPNFAGLTSVSFDGYGTPTSGGTVVVAAKDHACTVTLNGTTGEVTIASNHADGPAAESIGN